jgi:hypothetical protein
MGKKTVIAYEGRATGDGRAILPGALYWEDLPLPVFIKSQSSFESTIRVGQIVALERIDSVVWADLELDIEIPEGYVLSLDGMDSEISYKFDPLEVLFLKMRIAGGTLIPQESWAWQSLDDIM